MQTLIMLTEHDLMERYKLGKNFIRQHRHELGAIGKRKCIYDQELVEKKLREIAWAAEREREDLDSAVKHLENDLRQTIARSHAMPQIGNGKILGRGGKARP